MIEYRAKFDFVIHFTNGGTLRGEDFRLDIAGSDISDEALGARLIRDMRLLMAGKVEILHKRILEEPHKRSAAKMAELPEATIDLADGSLSAADLVASARHHAVRVIAADGESYSVSRYVT
jgi:hypothetical protein